MVIGIILAIAISPAVFNSIDTDLSRVRVLLRAAQNPDLAPAVVVLGNSVVMEGVDTRAVASALPGKPLVFNFSATGQTLVESFLYYQQLPASVEILIQMVAPGSLADETPLRDQKYNAYYMYGFRPTPDTAETLTSIFGGAVESILGASELSQRFRSRWVVRQMVDTSVRKLLRADLALSSATNDLYFPSSHALAFSPDKLQRALKLWFDRWPVRSYDALPQHLALVGAMSDSAKASERAFVLLLPPIHPWIREQRGKEFYREFRAQIAELKRQHGLRVVDALELLDSDRFSDHQHPSDDGARIVSTFIAQELIAQGVIEDIAD